MPKNYTEIDVFDQFVNGSYLVLLPLIERDIVHHDARDEDHGDTLILWGSRHKHDVLVKLVVNKGCKINVVSNADGNTAVDIYQEHNNQAMVDWLKERGGLSSDDLPRDEDGNLIEE
jgi:ankyrin repeat protein